MPTALIVYASWTGNTEEIAEILTEKLEELQVNVTLRECHQADPEDFMDYDIAVVGTYTYGSQGSLPEEIEDFYDDLDAVDLTGKIYGVLGSGEEIYGFFCKSVGDFDNQFQKTGALKGAESVKIEFNAKKEDIKRITIFAEELVNSYKTKLAR